MAIEGLGRRVAKLEQQVAEESEACSCRAWPPVVLAYADGPEAEDLVEGRCPSCGLALPDGSTVVQLDPEDRDL